MFFVFTSKVLTTTWPHVRNIIQLLLSLTHVTARCASLYLTLSFLASCINYHLSSSVNVTNGVVGNLELRMFHMSEPL